MHGLQMVLSESIFPGTSQSNLKVSSASAGGKAGLELRGCPSLSFLFLLQRDKRPQLDIWLLYFSLNIFKAQLQFETQGDPCIATHYLSLFCR